MAKYEYQAVSGCAIFGNPGPISKARSIVDALRPRYPDIEVERIALVGHNARRYWRWRNNRWSLDLTSDPAEADLARWIDQEARRIDAELEQKAA